MDVFFYPEHRNEPYPGQGPNDYLGYDSEDEDEDMDNEKIYVKPITVNKVYTVDPIDPKLGMRQVVFDVNVPTNLVPFEDQRMETIEPVQNTTYDLEGAIVRLAEQGVIANPRIIETINGQMNTIQLNINTLANTINEIHEHFNINAMQIDFTNVNNTINEAITQVNNNIRANFNQLTEIKNTYISNVQINNQFKEEITVGIEQKVKNITEINVANIISSLNVVSQNQNILVSDIHAIQDLVLKMYATMFRKRDNQGQIVYERYEDTPCSSNKLIKSSSSTTKPKGKDAMLIEDQSNDNNNDQGSSSNNVNFNIQSNRSVKRFRGPTDEDVTEPTRQSYYWDNTFTVDQMNEKYNKDYYGMFELQSIVEVPMLEEVSINIRNNNPNFVWDIDDDYVNTVKNTDPNDPAGYNPLGVRRFRINIAVDTNLLKDINEFSEMTFGNSTIDVATYNTALVKYDQNNEINPQELLERRLRVVDEYEGDGKTIYDSNEKVFINSHKYTIEEENENCDESNEGFNKVIQTTIVPVMDEITLPDITETNKTYKYSIKDYNDIYSLTPGSQNTYRNDFIGFSSINIPIKVNNKVVAGYGSTPNIYRPSDFDPDAIGFSSFQIEGTRDGGGSGGDSGSGSIKNLQNYVFKGNTVHPYTIREYNNSQYPPTDYTGFDAIIVDTNSNLEVLDVNVNKLGKYSMAYGEVENIMPVLSANTTDDIVLSGTPQWNNSNLTWYRLFDGNTTGENGFHSSSSISEGYLKIQFLNEKKSFNYFNCFAYSSYPGRAPTHIVVEGSDDDENYTELFNGNIAYVNLKSLQNVLINSGEYYYYKFTFSYTDGKSDYIEFTELQLMEYSTGGYKGVNVNVDLDNLMLSHSGTVENIENNTSNTYYPFDVLNSVIPVMNSYNSTGASIIDIVGSARNLNNFFDGNMYGSWVYLDSDDVSFVLNLDNPIIPRSIFFTFYYGRNNSVGEIKIYGSNDNLDYVKIFEKTNVFDESYFLKHEDNYLYENIDNENSYKYLKFELKRNLAGNVTYTREIRIFDVDKYLGFDKFTIVNNTYSKTSNPVATNLEPHNQRLYVNTDNSTTHPYVRREWMTVPLEDKVINYVGNYIPGDINVSSGYYGMRSITFNNTGDNTIACTDLIPVQTDDSNCNNGHLITGNYDLWYEVNNNVNTDNNIWHLFSDWNDIETWFWLEDSNYYYIKGNYPFIVNEILARQKYNDRNLGITVYGSKDGLNYVQIFDKNYDRSIVVDNKYVMYFDNHDYYLCYKVRVKRNTGDWNNLYKLQFCYCNGIEVISPLIYPNYQINVSQPGIYYYSKPEGWNGINNIILNVGQNERVELNRVYTHNTVENILPPAGKSYINQVNIQVDVQSNVINRSSSVNVNDNRNKIELDVSGDQILEYKYLYKINNPNSKSINIYYRYFGDNSSNVYILNNVNSTKYELFVQTEADKSYIYCYNYINNVKTFISKTEVNKKNLFVLGIENYNNNDNLNNCTFIKEIEVGKSNDIITDNPIDNNSNSVEIKVNNNPASSSGVIVNTSTSNKGVNVSVKDNNNNNVSVANNVNGSFVVWVRRIPNDEDNVEIEVIDDGGISYEPHVLPKSSVSKIITAMYDSNDNFVGYETKVWNSYYSEITFNPITDNSVKEISEVPDYDNDFGGTGMSGLSDEALKSLVEDFNKRNDNYIDYMSLQQSQIDPDDDIADFNQFLRDSYTPLMNGSDWNFSKLQAELTSRNISYRVVTTTITNGFPYGDSGVREWAFAPGDFNIPGVVIGTNTRIYFN